MEYKRLSINLIANVFSYLLATVFSFIITPFIINSIGKEMYGFYGIANNMVGYITIIATALNSMAAKYITVEMVKGNILKAQKYYSSIFFSNIILCSILTPILLYVVFNLKKILNISEEYLIEVQVLFAIVFGAMLMRFSTSIYGTATYITNRMDYKGYIDMAKAFLRFALYILLFMIFPPSIIYMGIVLFVLEGLNSIVQIMLSKRLIPSIHIKRKYFDLRLVVDTLKIGVWNSLNQMGDMLLSSSDLIMTNILLGEAASGNISIIKTLPTLISGIITAINSVFIPRAAKQFATEKTKILVAEIRYSQKVMGSIITPVVMILIIFSKEFFTLWIPGNDIELLSKLSIIDISRMMIIAVVWPVSNLNIILDKVKTPSILIIISGISNIISMILLTKFTGLGIYAIVITTFFITCIFYGGYIPYYAAKNLKIKWNSFMGSLWQMLISAILIFWVIEKIHIKCYLKSWLDFILVCGICGIVALIMSMIVFWYPELLKIVKKNK